MDGERRLSRCLQCNVVVVDPQPTDDEILQLYGAGYFEGADPRIGYLDYVNTRETLTAIARERFKLVERWEPTPGRLLDVGTATGEFLEAAIEKGWLAVGVEVSHFAGQIARQRGLRVFSGRLDQLPLDSPADVITMWDVIEHAKDPKAELERAHQLLRTGGHIVVGTPNRGSFRSRISGRRWWAYYVSREHLFYFDTRSLATLFRVTGFDVLTIYSRALDLHPRGILRDALRGRRRQTPHTPSISHIPKKGVWGAAAERLADLIGGHVLLAVGRKP